ncbi:MAG TPA: hypothetical protein VGU25_12795 [Acidobacteriaceae bacterium]|nr:hypothetical protein [Acidobacteriaceae bacterium]
MKSPSLRNAILVCALAFFFSWAFFFLKHNPLLRDIIPFAEDPYDAIGSLAFIAANLLAATSLARVLLPRFMGRSGASIYVSRTQAAVSLCVLMTVSADTIAMLRHLSQWSGTPGEPDLLATLASMLAASIGVLIIVCHRSQRPGFRNWATACMIFFAALLCLWFYPESLIHNLLPHLITCDLADVLLAVPVASFALALFPSQHCSTPRIARTSLRFARIPHWTIVALLGLAIGLAAFITEIRESAASVPITRLAFVGSVYAYLGLSGLLIAYAFLRKPLGFEITCPNHHH